MRSYCAFVFGICIATLAALFLVASQTDDLINAAQAGLFVLLGVGTALSAVGWMGFYD